MSECDLCIRGGLLIDGTGADGFEADIAINGGVIERVGELQGVSAKLDINAGGCIVSPGFIDVHSHSDAYLLIEPDAPNKITQGVTTEIVGNCGASAAPHLGVHRLPSDWAAQSYPETWSSMAGYRALLEQVRPGVNVGLMVGHSNIRASVIGYEERQATASEVQQMSDLLAESLDAGAIGFSTGLVYTPGRWSTPQEVTALCKVAAKHGAIYTSHMRSESAALLEAIDEVLTLGRVAGVRCQISHLKASGKANWHKCEAAISKIEAALMEGIDVAADRYPYTAGATELDIILPDWAATGGREKVLARLQDREQSLRIAAAFEEERAPDYWSTVMVGAAFTPETRATQGSTIAEIAQQWGISPGNAVCRLLALDELRTGAFFFGMDEANMQRILECPWVMIGSDSSIRRPTGPLSQDHPHPRTYGTFPRLLRWSLDGEAVALPEMIRKMTSLPAKTFGLRQRGELRAGMAADICVFNPEDVRDGADYATPHVYASGIEHVFVNGVEALTNGKVLGARSGRILV